ncbi:hypothetical protein C7B62_06475 [Pleurocapsa sp. CCALA 161]|uniref:hypothetical protein n=1 Tax=Pleurocapsa sp. CCALA 161 TaxID=2107688 RepID=UPI000D0765EC|nr:hypothetical protein [Pleurocapsa sp. CCALA 161]PSB11192.1 hypothetical protein C7B62_06475 [Pleurocapsa sp. CCALA 161]
MDNIIFNSIKLPLKMGQIVCLEHQGSNLYGEVIQLIPDRQLCWFRPLCLVICADVQSSLNSELKERSLEFGFAQQENSSRLLPASFDSRNAEETKLIDLQCGSDLLWPAHLFRPALDTEIIYLLPQLKDISHHSKETIPSQKYLNKFIHLFWQAHQDKF